MNTLRRDWHTWVRRAYECRNPLLWLSALNYDRRRYRLLSRTTGRSVSAIAGYLREIEDDADFIADVRARLSRWTAYRPRAVDFMMSGRSGSVFFLEVTLYAIVRAVKPEVMVETGGTPGKSTAFILRAMERNGAGRLYTIDLPPQSIDQEILRRREVWHEALPQGAMSGWAVPDPLKMRNTLLAGKSSDHLQPLLDRLEMIDIFLHDSDHSYTNMTWEFQSAYPHIRRGGLLISDDVLGNSSFFDFCRNNSLSPANIYNLGIACLP